MSGKMLLSAILTMYSVMLATTVFPVYAANYTVQNNTTHVVGDVIIDLDNNEQRTVFIGVSATELVDIGAANVVAVTVNGQLTNVGNTNTVSLQSGVNVDVDAKVYGYYIVDSEDSAP